MESDLIQERAAILEYDAGMTREEAEKTAARAYGYRDWEEYEIASGLYETKSATKTDC